ncbi:YqaJ viral recombinase family protein [Pseudoalteromonas nigrifaciens]|uniref:YqaJ viral recombinase family protein n=1 Tax=Pseudoalteromonas nigrifaciens TaxID=28109 RepID=UPI0017887C54|nr:YqaJ viral recombinase family protein [Pseudoalteromonas nigrifaciens]MBE0418521.1 YqaJ viral recombinase family protein [Pseudoalteromonas nigrifaciens]
MKILNLVQGSPQWHKVRSAHFTASEATAMLGLSKYKSRNQLLKEKATGKVQEVTQQQEKIFAAGHEYEAMARPIAEKIVNDELFPATGTQEVEGLPLLASFDGITMLEDQAWEHKTLNKLLSAAIPDNEMPDEYWPQLEHQLLVSGAERTLFMASQGTEETALHCWYESVPERREKVIAGWKLFANDLSNYVEKAEVEKVEAQPIRDLPAIAYKMDGLTLTSNLSEYKAAAEDLVEKSKKRLESDQDFANAESMVKVFKNAETKLEAMSSAVLGEVQDIDAFVKDLSFIKEQLRQARLATDKQVKSRKEEIKSDAIIEGSVSLASHINELNAELAPFKLPPSALDLKSEIKGKRTLESISNAIDTAVANEKINLSSTAQHMRININALNELAQNYQFLFNDIQQHLLADKEQFTHLVNGRISKYEQEQQEKEQQRQAEVEAQQQAAQVEQLQADVTRAAEQDAATERAEQHQALTDVNRMLDQNEPLLGNNFKSPVFENGEKLGYDPLDLWPSDRDRADNDELDRICNQLMHAESYIEVLEQRLNKALAA